MICNLKKQEDTDNYYNQMFYFYKMKKLVFIIKNRFVISRRRTWIFFRMTTQSAEPLYKVVGWNLPSKKIFLATTLDVNTIVCDQPPTHFHLCLTGKVFSFTHTQYFRTESHRMYLSFHFMSHQ